MHQELRIQGVSCASLHKYGFDLRKDNIHISANCCDFAELYSYIVIVTTSNWAGARSYNKYTSY